MNNIVGANWKTAVSGIGAGISSLLAVLATISLTPEAQAVIGFLSESQKVKVAIGGAIAALAFRFWNSFAQKSKEVTGGSVQQTMEGAKAKQGTQSLVDETVKGSIASGEPVTSYQALAVADQVTTHKIKKD